jgi:hypothetical protein
MASMRVIASSVIFLRWQQPSQLNREAAVEQLGIGEFYAIGAR